MALLEADVHYRVVKSFVEEVRTRALGQEVMASLTPGQQVVKIVNEKLTELMGSRHEALNLAGPPPAAVMLVGLQGSGKTTTAGKLAAQLRKADEGGRSGPRPTFTGRRPSSSSRRSPTSWRCRCFRRRRIRTRCRSAWRPRPGHFNRAATR